MIKTRAGCIFGLNNPHPVVPIGGTCVEFFKLTPGHNEQQRHARLDRPPLGASLQTAMCCSSRGSFPPPCRIPVQTEPQHLAPSHMHLTKSVYGEVMETNRTGTARCRGAAGLQEPHFCIVTSPTLSGAWRSSRLPTPRQRPHLGLHLRHAPWHTCQSSLPQFPGMRDLPRSNAAPREHALVT